MRLRLHHLRLFAASTVFCYACVLVAGATVPVAVACMRAANVPAWPGYEFDKLPAGASDGTRLLARANDCPRGCESEIVLGAIIAAYL